MFSIKLRSALEAEGIRQTELSKMTGIPKSAISTYYSGKCNPPKERRKKIALALNLPEDYFEEKPEESKLEWEEKEEKSPFGEIRRVEVKELAKMLSVSVPTAIEIAKNNQLPGLYACKGTGKERNVYIINEAVFCRL